MNKIQHPILFLRGSNTRGDNKLKIGPLSIGRMQERIEKTFHKNKIPLLSIENTGAITLKEQIRKSIDFIQSRDIQKFHFLGHSAGGLTARAISHHKNFSERVLSIVTIATPHHGSTLATQALTYNKDHPIMYNICKNTGYDTKAKVQSFEEFTPESTSLFNKTFPLLDHIKSASVVCQIPLTKQSLPFRIFHNSIKVYKNKPHDGILEGSSQEWGHQIGTYNLDHLSQIGFHLYFSPKTRKKQENEFQRMIRDILEFIS